ncbi:MAG TPA: hypothetical protein VGC15_00375 [Acetobacteraceae bacterium]
MGRFRRWAAILLPIVLIARAVLLVHQLRSEREERAHANDPPAWPPVPGEVLRFRADSPGLAAWAPDAGRRPLVAVLVSRGFETQPPDIACLLDPGAMGRNGGRLTLQDRAASGLWQADWSGHRTTRTRDEVDVPEPDPALRVAEAAMLDGAECGGTSRLELSEAAVQALVDTLAGWDPAQEVPPPRAGLNIHAVLPEQPR